MAGEHLDVMPAARERHPQVVDDPLRPATNLGPVRGVSERYPQGPLKSRARRAEPSPAP